MDMMRARFVSVLSFFVMWFCLVPLQITISSLVVSISTVLTVLFFSLRYGLLPRHVSFNCKILFYIFWLFKEIILSAVNVIKIAMLSPASIVPVIKTVRTNQQCSLGLTVYANSITLTPGTLTIDAADGLLVIHALDVSIMRDLENGQMERKVREILTVPAISKIERDK